MNVEKSAHNAYQIYYHFVTPLKYRKGLLNIPEREQYLVETCKEIQERYSIKFLEIGCDINHVHFLITAAPKYSPTQIMTMVKSITAKRMFKRFPELKRDLWGGEFWTDGFFVATVGEGQRNKEIIQNYIRNQGKKPEDMQMRLFGL